ncbi:GAF domain-containing protein [Egibacter rhizosphaerae]|uniref:GAF domain-containing protein n=1 Tax=Egibacter rhizosphaerae TaxID=1670831 RepID=A0A411YKA9_9ACTN|nr:GAF domain-containing sensor histidine kinase [Egibacter rhizosphaerae]QBI21648.1 GAF domain-containing protein [Egibacter rhizosphaerae]
METPDRLKGIADAASALAGELSLERVLGRIVELARDVTGAQYAALGVLGEDGNISRFLTVGIDAETIELIGHYPTGKGVLGLLIREPRIIRLDDIREHPSSYGFPPNHPEMTTFLGAPVRSRGRIYGNLYLTEKPGGFDDEDEQLLMALSAQAGAAIDNALLSDQLQSVAVADERERMARELHDSVIQALFSTGMRLEAARPIVESDPERVRERIDETVDALDDAIRELRSAIFHLRPGHASDLGPSRGLVELAREHEVQALTRPELDLPSDLDARLSETYVPDVLAIAREALTNATKHARAGEVHIRGRFEGSRFVLEIRDDGVGFSPREPRAGRGVENMHERADSIGGTLSIDSTPGHGATVTLTLELADAAA